MIIRLAFLSILLHSATVRLRRETLETFIKGLAKCYCLILLRCDVTCKNIKTDAKKKKLDWPFLR